MARLADQARSIDDEEALELCFGWAKSRYAELREALESAEKTKGEGDEVMQS